ncbi:flagellar assembly protein FliW [Desulfosporosinus sp. FKA]|uniref:flagellar assembly protein FliW n=1 Tax=Desulfosporosinus sp. FKA TaxID=1969834 RepID=UPI000B49D1A6|nr:flagellar assembly protein FliW [Desulfosporosinus sp. FKA]
MMEDKDNIYYFAQGIPGFEFNKEFRFVEEKGIPFAQLISVEEERIGFILIRPGLLFPDYRVDVDSENEEILRFNVMRNKTDSISVPPDGNPNDHVDVWAIVTLDRRDMAKSTVNLKAPILLNTKHKVGVQVILADERYLTKQPIEIVKPSAREQEGAVD